MSSTEPIGGYLELELAWSRTFPHPEAILLNSGRAAFELILQASRPTRVHIPLYTCDAVLEPLARAGVPYRFYPVTPNLEVPPELELGDGEYLVYTNYFGLKGQACDRLAQRYGKRLILDCAQALFHRSPRAQSFYSPRKFVGVPDGGCAYVDGRVEIPLEVDGSEQRCSHLLGRIERGAEAAYAEFRENEESLSRAAARRISALTRRILDSIDFDEVRRRRQENFAVLHAALGHRNRLAIEDDGRVAPLAYPYLSGDPSIRQRLIQEKIFVPTLWPNVLQWSAPGEWEHELASGLLPLPIDQRYGAAEMERIVRAIL